MNEGFQVFVAKKSFMDHREMKLGRRRDEVK